MTEKMLKDRNEKERFLSDFKKSDVIEKYLREKQTKGEIVNMVVNDLQKTKTFQNILFLRTPTTGGWMDAMMRDENVTRILYTIDTHITNRLYTILRHSELETHLRSLEKTFDLIIMDSYHEYKQSSSDFSFISSLLSEDGILISHDCCPPDKEKATPNFIKGYWCGVTYICFIELAYNNPQYYYAVIDNDNGVGIASKKPIDFLTQDLNREKQEIVIQMNKDGDPNTYDYFRANGKELINLYS